MSVNGERSTIAHAFWVLVLGSSHTNWNCGYVFVQQFTEGADKEGDDI